MKWSSSELSVLSFCLQNNARFRAHAGRIIRVFDESIQVLGQDGGLEKIDEIWTKIAVSHIPRKISKESYNVNGQLHRLFQYILYMISYSFYSNSRGSFWKCSPPPAVWPRAKHRRGRNWSIMSTISFSRPSTMTAMPFRRRKKGVRTEERKCVER